MSADDATKDEEPTSQPSIGSRRVSTWLTRWRSVIGDRRLGGGAAPGRVPNWTAFVVLPTVLVGLSGAAGWLTWASGDQPFGADVTEAAKHATVAMLSYQADAVDQQLDGATDLLTGPFKDSYAALIHNVVIPGAKQKMVSAAVSVPAVANVSADRDRAVVLVFINQTTTIGASPPTTTESAVRVSMEKVDRRWLVSGFDPI